MTDTVESIASVVEATTESVSTDATTDPIHPDEKSTDAITDPIHFDETSTEPTDDATVEPNAPDTTVQPKQPIDTRTIYQRHADPFVLKGDTCVRPGCTNEMESRQPCLACFGAVSYCSEQCMWDDYTEHNFECMKAQRAILRDKRLMVNKRQKQVSNAGYQKLLRHIITNVDRDTLLSNLFFIRLPFDTREKLKITHPVKRVARSEANRLMRRNGCLQETFRAYTKHIVASRDLPPFLYMFAYPPDMSFMFMTAIPFDEQEQFDEALQPAVELVACPCQLHSGA